MWFINSTQPSIKCARVLPTRLRPGSKGTYIVRLSRANGKQLKVKNGAYLRVSYGKASVLACFSIDDELDNNIIRTDQTLRTAICLEKIMQGSAKKKLIYGPGRTESLTDPIIVERSRFCGPTALARLVKQQYLVCLVHHAIPRDMETPLARLTKQSMEVVGIQSGDKVLLISETNRKSLRCLPLVTEGLPLKSMNEFDSPCEKTRYKDDLQLPWVTMDRQTRLALNVKPWHPILVGRDPWKAITSELNEVILAVALAAVGGSFFVPSDGFTIPILGLPFSQTQASFGIVFLGLVLVSILKWLKIRSRI